ncbi:MAG TPA: molybdopterin-guanine dinucleotide biosynthesis protein B [Azoarcus taiwanensis]|uniref:Molybdopterin-guanine dinucleotide biosynthesis protein B n=1 Tax=Azoarcus taiwanensis TaxID=666964 RepID=A0A972F6P5_9RHOO|nr:molybdopterin-guanine dinucleotide biosynthesis protein B [Azoarcus taiwanensis]NMG02382.1 molybdopterin-guanine dinucleotide biosynthesis protein B [Azoarcus taiwanensis]HRQ56328.1 molybdopterin-guanine dinucleotide biosynthesis protein B [Azoarcus taiwanensis]
MKVIGFAGWSGSGKTTLVEQVIGVLSARGLRVSLIKHAHHAFDIDHRGKDSWRHRQAGCREVIVSSRNRWSLIHELRDEAEASLDELLSHLSPCDIALVEGFKRAPIAKIEVYREGACESLLFPDDVHIVAVATDNAELDTGGLPILDINRADDVADFVLAHCFGHQPAPASVD